jgi:hypothetical protein
MDASGLRIALFSGNYNYVRDGANQALNRLVEYLLRQGAEVRIYSPTVAKPALPPLGEVVHIPSVAIPRRKEYKFPLGIPRSVRRDIRDFAPNIFHIASPDVLGHRAVTLARGMGVPVVASVHPLRNLPALLRLRLSGAGDRGDPAALLPALRRDLRAVRFDGAAAARAAHELRCGHLDPGH